jgi:hypothetical protein
MLIPLAEGDPSRMADQEVLIERDNANDTRGALQVGKRVRNTTLDVVHNNQEYI